jgi:hypothetical protein
LCFFAALPVSKTYGNTNHSFEAAEADCTAVLAFPGLSAPDQVKALLRRGTARIHKNELEGATADFKQVLALEPNNRQAREELRVSKLRTAWGGVLENSLLRKSSLACEQRKVAPVHLFRPLLLLFFSP